MNKIQTGEFVEGFNQLAQIANQDKDHYFQVKGGKITVRKAPGRLEKLFNHLVQLFHNIRGSKPKIMGDLEYSLTDLYKKAIKVLRNPDLTPDQFIDIRNDFESINMRISKIRNFKFSKEFKIVVSNLKFELEAYDHKHHISEPLVDEAPKPSKPEAVVGSQDEFHQKLHIAHSYLHKAHTHFSERAELKKQRKEIQENVSPSDDKDRSLYELDKKIKLAEKEFQVACWEVHISDYAAKIDPSLQHQIARDYLEIAEEYLDNPGLRDNIFVSNVGIEDFLWGFIVWSIRAAQQGDERAKNDLTNYYKHYQYSEKYSHNYPKRSLFGGYPNLDEIIKSGRWRDMWIFKSLEGNVWMKELEDIVSEHQKK